MIHRVMIIWKCIGWMLLFLIMSPGPAGAADIHVPADHATIQAAIDAAVDGDTVIVADGVWTGDSNKNLDPDGKSITVRSENGAAGCTIDCEGAGRGFIVNSGETAGMMIRGFTVCNGNPMGGGYGPEDGGAIFVNSAALRIESCVFRSNQADWGGAVCISDAACAVVQCGFTENIARSGGAVTLYGDMSGLIVGGAAGDGNTFTDNLSPTGADLCAYEITGGPVDARFNTFSGYCFSDYYVSPAADFDLTGCSSLLSPVTQDVYVSPAGSDSHDGLTWNTAFKTVQFAMSRVFGTEADPVTVHLAAGTYSPSATGEIFPLPMMNHVILSGAGAADVILNAEQTGGVMLGVNDTDLEITGITITGGRSQYFAGLRLENCSGTVGIRDCIFAGNQLDTYFGGGIALFRSSPEITGCTISGNQAAGGGGIICFSTSSPVISGCTITGNTGGDGGGIACNQQSSPEIRNCTISGNSATGRGGGINCYQGSNPVITGCAITDNTAMYGGAIGCDNASPVIGGSVGDGNSFSGNRAAVGADLCVDRVPGDPVNAGYNQFAGYQLSNFYVSNPVNFDLTGCTSSMTPISGDLYVAPDGSDGADGRSPGTAFRTLRHALSRAYGSDTDPVIIHLAAGTYSPAATGESFPLPLLDHLILSGAGRDSTILNAAATAGVVMAWRETGAVLEDMTVTGGAADRGAGLSCVESDLLIRNCAFTGNDSRRAGGGIYCSKASPTICHTVFQANAASSGAGLTCDQSGSPVLFNCLFLGNDAEERGGGIWCKNSAAPALSNCTFTANTAQGSGGGMGCDAPGTTVADSIFRSNSPDSIDAPEPENITVQFSNVQGGFTGTGNMDVDPLFVTGPCGTCYLSQQTAGQTVTSQCVDAGSSDAAAVYQAAGPVIEHINVRATRSDGARDRGILDLGYHYDGPAAGAAPGCTVHMPAQTFHADSECFCDVFVTGAAELGSGDLPLFVILDVFGRFFFAPSFTEFDRYTVQPAPGSRVVEVLPAFLWPAGTGAADGILWYAAITDTAVTEILGELGSFRFGWDTLSD